MGKNTNLDFDINLSQLAQIEQLEELRTQCRYLMTSRKPAITVHVDGKTIHLQGHDARALGIGMQVVLSEIGYPAVDSPTRPNPWTEK